MQNILDRSDEELLKKVFNAQKVNPVGGDFVKLVESDLKQLGIRHEGDIGDVRIKKKELKVSILSTL